ncbi:glutathione S-transferase N-terminal domain-containing protein [Roseomonas sp. SSH11]|uniref:Glutathione S-transferase N-terminal domain-containing protein n=1 Tax=Pararoseomonas baculiformis TaxID=2820812 RepID=A0ABS4AB35_9PROT|nr:glutathione S-transferase N-terminal domain-containing protein [Pararoseomonas baculiformis]MBP0444213.1 glutathione S-transferase N-terminal domain-containing protein [Pararoseomonas baculiformis]
MAARFLLHHAPKSRSFGSLWLLEEAGAGYELSWHSLEAATNRTAEYLAVNPAGKLPALVDRGPEGDWNGVVVTEAAAIAAYVADALPEARLAPPIGSPARAAYAFWMAYAPGVMEPAMADMAFPRAKPAPARALGWPGFPDTVLRAEAALTTGPWLVGNQFTAADILLGGLLAWVVEWGMLQPGPVIARYLDAIEARPARQAAIRKGAAPQRQAS